MMKQSGALMSSRLMPPKDGPRIAHRVDELVDVLGVDLEVDRIDVGEALEEHRLAFHHRLRGERAEIAEAEDRGAVGDDGDQVAARRVVEGGVRILGDRLAPARRRPANRRATGRAASPSAWSAMISSLPGRPSAWKSSASWSVTDGPAFAGFDVSFIGFLFPRRRPPARISTVATDDNTARARGETGWWRAQFSGM